MAQARDRSLCSALLGLGPTSSHSGRHFQPLTVCVGRTAPTVVKCFLFCDPCPSRRLFVAAPNGDGEEAWGVGLQVSLQFLGR